MRYTLRKRIALMLAVVVLATAAMGTFSGCGGGGELIIWTFTDELQDMVTNYYKKDNPDAKVKVVATPIAQYTSKLERALETNSNLPDIVALEEKYVRRFLEKTNSFENLNDLVTDDMYDYTLNSAKVGNEVRALAWQATPGALFYRTDIAENVLGITTQDAMQERVSTWEGIINVAAELKEDNIFMFSSVSAPSRVFFSQREHGWVENNTLVIDQSLTEGEYSLMEITRKLQTGSGTYQNQNPYINQTTESTTDWYADMASDKVFSYFLPSWGLHYDLKRYAKSSSGDNDTTGKWGIVKGPGVYSDGGTWLSVLKTSKQKELAKDIVRYFTSNEDFLSDWAKDKGDFVNNKTVTAAYKNDDTFGDAFLGGQNHYKVLYEIADQLSGNNLTQYDSQINAMFIEWTNNYAKGENTKTDAIAEFKNGVSGAYRDLTV